jgi:hypothetical protein
MVSTHEKEVARKLTVFCEFLKKGNAVVLARLCNKNKCVVASSILLSFGIFRPTPGSTLQYAYLLRKNLALPGFLYIFFEYSLTPVFERAG